ncbi:replicative DNA helicase [Mesosutterella sp. AGMB02718]|uniref:Replicative DNA helicase n=1 Tax=Mesosutterella faecium TaxID=2925194 RepID=A0ABT7ILM2_9BURK|nr:replicative DNA helicase [Mesosutterella sp. AGMB02718]MDL2059262.1 replicative DNA helicase [Mesosutterella sp. AGMB02718]
MPEQQDKHAQPQGAVRVPPNSIDSEQTILGGLMLNSEAFDQISDVITAEDFYRADHRIIFEAITSLHTRGEPADVLTVFNELERSGRSEAAGGRPYLISLTTNSLGAANIRQYAQIVRDCSMLRQLISAGDQIVSSALAPNGRETKDIIDDAERLVLQINEKADRGGKGFVRINKLAANVSDVIADRYRTHSSNDVTGIPTGYRFLDLQTSGMQPGDLIIIAGRPSMGKTALALNIAEHVAFAGRASWPVAVFSMEMSGEQLAMRLICSHGRLDAQKVRRGRLDEDGEWDRFTTAVADMEKAPLYIDDTPGLNVTSLRSRARRLMTITGQLGLIVVDYLQLMSGSGRSREENRATEISEISRGLKSLAKELRVPVIALSQLNRSVDSRPDKRPVMSDLRESGAIEQDADVIMFIYRDWVYNKDSDPTEAEVIIGKQRNGPIGTVKLTFNGKYTSFETRVEAPEGYIPDDVPREG